MESTCGRQLPHARPESVQGFHGHGTDIGSSGLPGYLSKAVTAHFSSLPLCEDAQLCMVEYVWITRAGVAGAASPGQAMRSKTRVLGAVPLTVADVPSWSSDGLSSNQGTPEERLSYKIVLCEARLSDGRPTPSNTRAETARLAVHPASVAADMWIGFEQEQALFEADKKHPLGWPPYGVPEAQTLFLNYCGVGGDATGREIMASHLQACLYAGLHVVGCNLEVLVGSLEYQLAPLPPLAAADEAWMGRYLMARVAEEYGVNLSYDPKPVPNADGCAMHTNVSIAPMRCTGPGCGLRAIADCMELLSVTHKEHVAVYGPGLERRLVGREEYSSIDVFTWGVGDRSASVRIPFEAARGGSCYFEDRRPGSNADPYQVASRYLRTLVVGPVDPTEDPGGKLGAVAARLRRQGQMLQVQTAGEVGGGRALAREVDTGPAGEGEGWDVADTNGSHAAPPVISALVQVPAATSREFGTSQEQGRVAPGPEQQPSQVPSPEPPSPHLKTPLADPHEGERSTQARKEGNGEEARVASLVIADRAQSPTLRQLLARSHTALAYAVDSHPSQRVGAQVQQRAEVVAEDVQRGSGTADGYDRDGLNSDPVLSGSGKHQGGNEGGGLEGHRDKVQAGMHALSGQPQQPWGSPSPAPSTVASPASPSPSPRPSGASAVGAAAASAAARRSSPSVEEMLDASKRSWRLPPTAGNQL